MLCKKRLREINQLRNRLITRIGPVGSKFKTVASLFALLALPFPRFFDVAGPGGIGVVLGMCAVGDDKNLDVLKQAAGCQELSR